MQENGETIDMAGDDIFKRPDGKIDNNVSPSKRDKTESEDESTTTETVATTGEVKYDKD